MNDKFCFIECPSEQSIAVFDITVVNSVTKETVVVLSNSSVHTLKVTVPVTLKFTVRIPAAKPPVECKLWTYTHLGATDKVTDCSAYFPFESAVMVPMNISLTYVANMYGIISVLVDGRDNTGIHAH